MTFCRGPCRAHKAERRLGTQNGRRFKDHNDLVFTLTGQDRHGVAIPSREVTVSEDGPSIDENGNMDSAVMCGQNGRILGLSDMRCLTPLEYGSIQGFPDGWTGGLSESRRTASPGDAVMAPIIENLGRLMVVAP